MALELTVLRAAAALPLISSLTDVWMIVVMAACNGAMIHHLDPTTGTFAATCDMAVYRSWYSATLLADTTGGG